MTRENQLSIDHDDEEYHCHSCDRYFNTSSGALSHCRNAQVHRGEWCERCEWLFVSPAALESHVDNSSHHNICDECNSDFWTFDDLEEHNVDVHNKCDECGQRFSNHNNLEQHKRVHLPVDIECFACYRQFSEFSAMILHLESGACSSSVDLDDIDNWVFDDHNCAKYTNHWTDNYRFRCPTCDTDFRFVSGLLQHIASNACDRNLKRTIQDFTRCFQCRV